MIRRLIPRLMKVLQEYLLYLLHLPEEPEAENHRWLVLTAEF